MESDLVEIQKLTVDNIKAGDNIEIVKSGNNVTIKSTAKGGSDLKIYEGQNINFTYNTSNAIFSDGTSSLDDFILDNTDYRFGLKQANSIDELVVTRNSYYIETVNSSRRIYNYYYNIDGFATSTSKIRFDLSTSSSGTKVYAGNTATDLTEVTPSSSSTYGSIIIDMATDHRHIFKVENEQLGFESLVNLSYQQNDIVEQEDNSKYGYINNLLGKDIVLNDKEYKVSKINIESNGNYANTYGIILNPGSNDTKFITTNDTNRNTFTFKN